MGASSGTTPSGSASPESIAQSGFIMSMVALLEENPNPTRAEAAQGLSGNLCRCGDYNKILNSAMRASEYVRRS